MTIQLDLDGRMEIALAQRLIFARNLRNARIAANLSQRDLQKNTGFAQAWISKVETGQSAINIDNMAVFANYLGLPLWKLLVP